MSQIPAKAKKVFSWVIFDIYQRPQKMFDWTTKTFEMVKKIYTVETIPVTKKWKIIITKQTQPNRKSKIPDYVCFPWGRLDEWENIEQWAKRELEEETWLQSDSIFLFKTYKPYHKIDYKFHLFIAKDCDLTGKQELDGWEKIEILEVNFDDMIDMICAENYWNPRFANDIFRMKENWEIWNFKKLLWCK